MTRQRVVRPAELPRQRGTRPSAPLPPGGRPPVPSAPRSGRRAPRTSPVAESVVGFLLCVLVIGLTIAAIAVVLAAWTGLA